MRFFFTVFCFFFIVDLFAQDNYPVPLLTENRLFYIQHSKNFNTYVYDANFLIPKYLNEKEPVQVYRIVYTEGGIKKPLTTFQRKLAYGIESSKISPNIYKLKLVAYSGFQLVMKIGQDGKAFVETTVNNQTIILTRMFLKMKEGRSDFNPKLEYVLFYGFDNNGNKTSIRVYPS
ncbi:MAG TPA: DUF4833 domain-containing protein [Sediminibacterium sp.]|uniref:DUF4833 domain-containing protein n=1 Tax=Sediminibacterium sp. TaxID=1917865 RepID=UPI0008D05ABB|nr:DUF4833 domain-containing protein [Sediminibacterium sp.]OHC84204.1 MAG: hypothetical protein A2472_12130 [Sphingobacteriia bacterium RIFOXYC2_FULL_35_18]OHC88842.1 MAG: hypothetical protein A2546_03055 [Sphingobacteriia bacterium RIFOXYD2_FULL_35_12]HLD53810.1 DUF4833 domain-containing protein [Sediminibacterium sp.]